MQPHSVLILIFLVIALAILITNIWNLFTNRNLIRTRQFKDVQLNDAKYFELKSKQEFLLATFSIVIAVIVFVGYDSYKSLTESLKTDFAQKVDSTNSLIKTQKDTLMTQQQRIISLNDNVQQNIKDVNNTKELLSFLMQEQEHLKQKLNNSKLLVQDYDKNISELSNKISQIKNKNIIKQEIYIVNNLAYSWTDNWVPKKINFDTLKTSDNQFLPTFSDPPAILPFTNIGIAMTITKVTASSFEIIPAGDYGGNNNLKSYPLYLFIFVTDK